MDFKLVSFLALLLSASWCCQAQDTAALIVGGYFETDRPTITSLEVELFGCRMDGVPQKSIRVSDFPEVTWLPAGVLLREDSDPQEVLVCGGYTNTLTDQCFRYNPSNNAWTEDTPLAEARWGHTFQYIPDARTGSDGSEVPVIFGGTLAQCEVYDPTVAEWSNYTKVLPEAGWFYSQCMVVVDGYLYHWNNDQEIDTVELDEWDYENIGQLPVDVLRPGRCASVAIDGVNGIMTRSGYWMSTETRNWQYQQVAPYNPAANVSVNSMFSLWDRPTIFGLPDCNDNFECPMTEVSQYDPERNIWVRIGSQLYERTQMEVVEVPMSYCDYFANQFEPDGSVDPNYPIPTTTVTPPTTVSTTSDSTYITTGGECEVSTSPDKAALIVGGFFMSGVTFQEVELFGCRVDGVPQKSIKLADFPEVTWLPAGVLLREDKDPQEVLVCGGYTNPKLTDKCYRYNPSENVWTEDTPLNADRWGHTIQYIPDARDGSDGTEVPVILGGNLADCELYDTTQGTWSDYNLDLPEANWFYTQCLVVVDGYLYHWNADQIIDMIELDDWVYEDIGQLPVEVTRPGRCASACIDGINGIMTRSGYWMSTETRDWQYEQVIPVNPTVNEPVNAMFTLWDRPTIFGLPDCNDQFDCPMTQVSQYDPENNLWVRIGSQLYERTQQEVVEVPMSYCDYFADQLVPDDSVDPNYPIPIMTSTSITITTTNDLDDSTLASTATTVTSSTGVTVGTCSNIQVPDTAALLVGGFFDPEDQKTTSLEVELFGCRVNGVPQKSIQVADFPEVTWLPAGILLRDNSDPQEVLVCGGFTNILTNQCFRYNPSENAWTEDTPLLDARWGHTIQYIPDARAGSNGSEVPVLFGGTMAECEVYDPSELIWANYENDLPEVNWFYSQCLVVVDGYLYHWNADQIIDMIELDEWDYEDIGQLPVEVTRPGRCASACIDGNSGIMTRSGYWMSTETRDWQYQQVAPNNPTVDESVNAMFTLWGRPTIFGLPDCNDNFECPMTEVSQYDPERNDWIRLGSQLYERTQQEVVEVPMSYCDYFLDQLEPDDSVDPSYLTTTTTTTTTSTTTTITTSTTTVTMTTTIETKSTTNEDIFNTDTGTTVSATAAIMVTITTLNIWTNL